MKSSRKLVPISSAPAVALRVLTLAFLLGAQWAIAQNVEVAARLLAPMHLQSELPWASVYAVRAPFLPLLVALGLLAASSFVWTRARKVPGILLLLSALIQLSAFGVSQMGVLQIEELPFHERPGFGQPEHWSAQESAGGATAGDDERGDERGDDDPSSPSSDSTAKAQALLEAHGFQMVQRNTIMEFLGAICSLDANGMVRCFDNGDHCVPPRPRGTFSALAAAKDYACGLRRDGHLFCWGPGAEHFTAPELQAKRVSVGDYGACAIDSLDGLQCWHDVRQEPKLGPPSGRYLEVSVGAGGACAVRQSGELICWGHGPHDGVELPSGKHLRVQVGATSACAISDSGRLNCWGTAKRWPSGPGFVELGAGPRLVFLDMIGQVSSLESMQRYKPPTGLFVEVGPAGCARTSQGKVICLEATQGRWEADDGRSRSRGCRDSSGSPDVEAAAPGVGADVPDVEAAAPGHEAADPEMVENSSPAQTR